MNRLIALRRVPTALPASAPRHPGLPPLLQPGRRSFSTRAQDAPNAPSTPAQGPSARSLLFFAIPIGVTFSLGIWQVRRLQWKLHLIEDRKRRLAAEPLAPTAAQLRDADLEYRRVHVRGRFLHPLEMLVGPRSAPKELPTPVLQWGGSSGLQVLTPFELEGGGVVMVNRGWVPQRLSNPAKRSTAAVTPLTFLTSVSADTPLQDYEDSDVDGARASDLKAFTGVVRGRDERNRFTPDNKPRTDEWYFVDPEAMLSAKGIAVGEKVAVVELLEPLPKDGWPYPRSYGEYLQFRTPPSTHITYATTWFCLSGALALLTRNRLRQPVAGRST